MRIRTDAGGTALALMLLCGGARAEGAPFSITEIPVDHRVAQADIADLDGDGRGDLLWVALEGVPPTARREIRAHFQRA